MLHVLDKGGTNTAIISGQLNFCGHLIFGLSGVNTESHGRILDIIGGLGGRKSRLGLGISCGAGRRGAIGRSRGVQGGRWKAPIALRMVGRRTLSALYILVVNSAWGKSGVVTGATPTSKSL